MQITDDITTDDATVVLYHDGSTTSTLTFVFLLLARQSPNQFGLCSCLVRRFFVSVVTGTAYPNINVVESCTITLQVPICNEQERRLRPLLSAAS